MHASNSHHVDIDAVAAAGAGAAVRAATDNAAEMHVNTQGLQVVPTPIPEPESHFVSSGQVEVGHGNASGSSNYVGTAPEQLGRIAKKRSRPFKIPR